MSRGELASAADIDQTSVSTLERDLVKRPRKLQQIAHVLGVPEAWLLFGHDDLPDMTDAQIEAVVRLTALSPDDQAAVIQLIERLSRK